MDPDVALAELRRLADLIQQMSDDEDAVRLAELVIALDEWLSKGGFLPKDWRDVILMPGKGR